MLPLPFCFSYDDISIWLCRELVCGVCGCGWRRRPQGQRGAIPVCRLLLGARCPRYKRVRLLMLAVLLLLPLLLLLHLLLVKIIGGRLLFLLQR